MAEVIDIEKRIQQLGFDAVSAQNLAKEGKIEEWVHRYLLSGEGGRSNPQFSEGLKQETRWWNGPVEMDVADLSPAVGTEPGLEYVVDKAYWHARISKLAQFFTTSSSLPPLIVEYRSGELSVRDGNTRLGAIKLLGWAKCWVVIWYNSKEDFVQHSSELFGE